MVAELIILLGAILGAFGVFLVFQLRKTLIEKQIPLNDIDAIVKALFEIEINREFALKLAIGTGIGALGAILAMTSLVEGAPVNGSFQDILLYGFLWGFAGNGILRVFTMIPDIFTVLNITKENASLKRENQALAAQNQTLQAANLNVQEEKQQPLEITVERDLTPAINSDNNPTLETHKNPDGSITV